MRNRPLLSGLGALLIAIVPSHALAQTTPAQQNQQSESQATRPVAVQERPHPETDPLGKRLGGFDLNASLDLDVASTDNLFSASSSDAVDDIIYLESPHARLSSHWSRHALVIEAGAQFTQHQDFSNEDWDSHFVRAAGRLDVGSSTSINASARVAHQVTPRTDPDTPSVGSPVEYDRNDASIGVDHRFGRFRVRADTSYSTYDYEGAQNFRDNNRTELHGRLDFEVSPRIGLSLQATGDHRDYDNTPGLSSDGQVYLAGVTLDGDLFRGELSAGYFRRDFNNAAVPTFDGLALAGDLQWFLTELTTVTLDARRDANAEISATAGLPYVTTEAGIRADHELFRNVILMGEVHRGKREYDTVDREDNYTRAAVGADYILNRHAALHLRFEHFDNDSSGTMAYHDSNVNVGTLGVSLRL